MDIHKIKTISDKKYIEILQTIFKDFKDENITSYEGLTNAICPICKTKIYFSGTFKHFEIHCQTKGCFQDAFRGI